MEGKTGPCYHLLSYVPSPTLTLSLTVTGKLKKKTQIMIVVVSGLILCYCLALSSVLCPVACCRASWLVSFPCGLVCGVLVEPLVHWYHWYQ
jgi:hypothetical protein